MILAFLYLQIGTAFYPARSLPNSHSRAIPSSPWSTAATPGSQRRAMQPEGKACRRKSGLGFPSWTSLSFYTTVM